jgi:hypothetical protein
MEVSGQLRSPPALPEVQTGYEAEMGGGENLLIRIQTHCVALAALLTRILKAIAHLSASVIM